MNTDTILGIDPGTRLIGIAVVQEHTLVHHQINAFQESWSHKKLRKIIKLITTVMEYYGVTSVAVKIPDILPASIGFTQVIGAINALCNSNGITARYYTLTEIKAGCGNKKANAKELMTAIALKYPELMPEYQREQRNKEGYYYKIFEAVAVAEMKMREL